MKAVARVVVYLIGLMVLAGAAGFIFTPAQMLENFAIQTTRVDGWGTLRADLGGPFLGIAWFTFVGAQAGKSKWLLVPVVFMATFLIGRIIHLALDGVTQPGITSFVIEAVMLVGLEGSRRVLNKS
jgi:hypothetical protein